MKASVLRLQNRASLCFRFYRDAFRVLVLRKSLDEVARINGWRFHTDGVHLNSVGGMIVADLIQKFIEIPPDQSVEPTPKAFASRRAGRRDVQI